jgi:hypothetical protein
MLSASGFVTFKYCLIHRLCYVLQQKEGVAESRIYLQAMLCRQGSFDIKCRYDNGTALGRNVGVVYPLGKSVGTSQTQRVNAT